MSSNHLDEHGFDLGKFRYLAAALVRYLIRAREGFDRGFLGGPDAYADWELRDIGDDKHDPSLLLQLATAANTKIWNVMLEMGGSGGIPFGDPLGELKSLVSSFAVNGTLEQAVQLLDRREQVDWTSLARWDDLPRLRTMLNALPHPGDPSRRDAAGGASDGPYPPDRFYFNGELYEMPGKLPYKLVAHLWLCTDRCCSKSALSDPVWGDREELVTDGQIGSLHIA